MPTVIIPGAVKRNVYLFSDDHTEKRDTNLPATEWVNDEITEEREARIAADAVLQANIDAEEARAEAAEALKEDKANKVASTDTYVSNDTKYPTTASVDARIAELSPLEVKYATQNVTTFAQIKAWLNDNKLVVAKCGDGENELYVTDIYDDSVFFCRVSGTYSERYIVDNNGWHLSSNSLEQTGNKVTSSATYVSDNTKYPTTAAVDARIAEISPKEIEWAHNNNQPNTTPFATIKGWIDSGKAVMMNVGGTIYMVTDHNSAEIRFSAVYYATSYAAPKLLDYLVTSSNVWTFKSYQLETIGNKLVSTSTWSSSDTKYPTTAAVDARIAAVSPKQVEWATYGTTTYSQIKSWNDAGKAVFLKYTVGGPVDYIMKLTIVTPGGAFFCGIQGISEYTAEVNPANQWSYNNSGLQASALVHEYETWDETDDTSYPTLASVSNYVASHAGGGVHVFTRGGTEALAEVQAAFDAGEVCVCYDETEDVYMQLISLTDWQASFAAVDSSHWLYNTAAWDGEWDDCWTNHLLLENHVSPSSETWESSDNRIPTNKAVENYVAAHSGGDVYEISCAESIPIPCNPCLFNDTYNVWELKFAGSGTMYSPRINFKLLKNGNELPLNSDVKIVAEPYVASGTKTYSSGQYFNAPNAPNWGQMSQESYPSASAGKYFGIKIMQSASSASPDNSYIFIMYSGGGSYVGSSGLDSAKCYFVLSLYDKNVSQTVPVARKIIQIVPTYMVGF